MKDTESLEYLKWLIDAGELSSGDQRETVRWAYDEIVRLQAMIDSLPPETIFDGAMTEWIETVLAGEPVSDFAESFGTVTRAQDLRREVDRLREENSTLRTANLIAYLGDGPDHIP